jgi:transposase-like protein
MLPSNIDKEIERILRKNNGWLRIEQCAKQYARNRVSGEIDGTKRTQFYRWRKQLEKSKNPRFQIITFPRNVSFIGLKDADPKELKTLVTEDKNFNQKEIRKDMADAIIYYRILETQFDCEAAGKIANILEDLSTKFKIK